MCRFFEEIITQIWAIFRVLSTLSTDLSTALTYKSIYFQSIELFMENAGYLLP